MQAGNPFDKKLELNRRNIPTAVQDAIVFVNDTLDLCLASAQSVFEDKATPEHAFAIYDRVVARMKIKQDAAELERSRSDTEDHY